MSGPGTDTLNKHGYETSQPISFGTASCRPITDDGLFGKLFRLSQDSWHDRKLQFPRILRNTSHPPGSTSRGFRRWAQRRARQRRAHQQREHQPLLHRPPLANHLGSLGVRSRGVT
jgi:hypothetical protein